MPLKLLGIAVAAKDNLKGLKIFLGENRFDEGGIISKLYLIGIVFDGSTRIGMSSSVKNPGEREAETFYPLTRDQLEVEGIPVIRIKSFAEKTGSDKRPEQLDSERSSQSPGDGNERVSSGEVARKWEETSWSQISQEELDTNSSDQKLKNTPIAAADQPGDSTLSSVPRYQPKDQIQRDDQGHGQIGHSSPSVKKDSFLEQLSQAEFSKPESRYNSEIPKPHFAKQNDVVFSSAQSLDSKEDFGDDPSSKNFLTIKERLISAENKTQQSDVPAATRQHSGQKDKKLPFWKEVAFQCICGMLFVIGLIGFSSNFSGPNDQATNDSHSLKQESESPSLRVAER